MKPLLLVLTGFPIRYAMANFVAYLQEIQDPFSLPEQGFDVSLTQKQLQEEHGYPLDM
jgi:hypothetical protein